MRIAPAALRPEAKNKPFSQIEGAPVRFHYPKLKKLRKLRNL
jgi:hypothetical protein